MKELRKEVPIRELQTEFLGKLKGLTYQEALYVLEGVQLALLTYAVIR